MKSNRLAKLVGVGNFFCHVSARMAYALPIGHQLGLREDTHSASTRPGSFNQFTADFYATERSTGFLGYVPSQGNAITVSAGERVLLAELPDCSMIFDGIMYLSDGSEEMWYLDPTTGAPAEFTSYTKLRDAARNLGLTEFLAGVPVPADGETLPAAVRLPVSDCHGGDGFAAFPAFDLYATRFDACLVGDDPMSFPTIRLADAAGMTGPLVKAFEPDAQLLPQTDGCSDWLVWMQPTADIPLGSFMTMKWEVLTQGK